MSDEFVGHETSPDVRPAEQRIPTTIPSTTSSPTSLADLGCLPQRCGVRSSKSCLSRRAALCTAYPIGSLFPKITARNRSCWVG